MITVRIRDSDPRVVQALSRVRTLYDLCEIIKGKTIITQRFFESAEVEVFA
jgi:hypothetical protein